MKEADHIPKKKKPFVIPEDLKQKMGAVEACATAFSLIDKGLYPHSHAKAVLASLQFLQTLHGNCVEEALKHPQAHMINELKEALKAKKALEKEAKDGQAKN